MRRILILALSTLVLLYGLYQWKYPTYRWVQTLTITFETPQGDVVRQSETEVLWQARPRFFTDGPDAFVQLSGGVITLDVGADLPLSLLDFSGIRLAFQTFFDTPLPPLKFGDPNPNGDLAQIYKLMNYRSQTKIVNPEYIPYLNVSFMVNEHPEDTRSSGRQAKVTELQTLLGEGYSVKHISMTIDRWERVFALIETLGGRSIIRSIVGD